MGYTKLDKSIIYSSLWQESDAVRLLWIALLAVCDKNGEVRASIPGLSAAARLSLSDTQKALDVLMSPDPHDKSGIEDGRRIVKIEGGFEIVNYVAYCKLHNDERTRELCRERQRRRRARLKNVTRDKRDKRDSHECHDNETETETETESDSEATKEATQSQASAARTSGARGGGVKKKAAKKKAAKTHDRFIVPPPYEMVRDFGLSLGMEISHVRDFFDYWESEDWKRHHRRMKDWQATMRLRLQQLIERGKAKPKTIQSRINDEASTLTKKALEI